MMAESDTGELDAVDKSETEGLEVVDKCGTIGLVTACAGCGEACVSVEVTEQSVDEDACWPLYSRTSSDKRRCRVDEGLMLANKAFAGGNGCRVTHSAAGWKCLPKYLAPISWRFFAFLAAFFSAFSSNKRCESSQKSFTLFLSSVVARRASTGLEYVGRMLKVSSYLF